MGAQASEELDKWVSVSDLALATRRMRVIPALPSECQVEVLKILWRSLRWVPAGEILVTPSQVCDRMFVIARGEAEVLLGHTDYIPLLSEGTFVCEAALLGFGAGLASGEGTARSAVGWGQKDPRFHRPRKAIDPVWALRRDSTLPTGPLSIVADFILPQLPSSGPRFQGKVRTVRRSLIGELSRDDLLRVLRVHGSNATRELADMPASCNVLQNVTVFGVEAQQVNANDIAARVVCDGPMHMSCQSVVGGVKQGLFGSCMRPDVDDSEIRA